MCWRRGIEAQTPTQSALYTAVVAGGVHTYALVIDQNITCWGSNEYGQTTVPSGTYTALSAGAFHTCGLTSDNIIVCWGTNDDGQATAPVSPITLSDAGVEQYVTDLETGLAARTLERDNAQSDLLDAETQLSLAQTSNDTLAGELALTQAERDQAAADLNQAETDLATRTTERDSALSDLDQAETERDSVTGQRDDLLVAPVCELNTPTAVGTKSHVGLSKTLAGTVRWSSPASKANVQVTITRVTWGYTEYWVSGATWSFDKTSRTVVSGATYAGTKEAPWKLAFPMPSAVGVTYTVSCTAVDSVGNTSPTADIGKLISVA